MTDRTAVALTGLVVSALGCSWLLYVWSRSGLSAGGLTRCLVFALVMALVCSVGFRAYQGQRAPAGDAGPGAAALSDPAMRIAPDYAPAIRVALLQEFPVLLVSASLLDGGHVFRSVCVSVLGHWASALLILARRPGSPTRLDLSVIRYGFWPLLFVTGRIAPLVWRLTGQV